jgi:hypothetical protein
MFIFICICIFIYTHTYIHIYEYTYLYIFIYAYIGFFIQIGDMPHWIRWISYLIPTKYSFDGYLYMIFHGQTFFVSGSDEMYISGDEVLSKLFGQEVCIYVWMYNCMLCINIYIYKYTYTYIYIYIYMRCFFLVMKCYPSYLDRRYGCIIACYV